MSMTPAEVKDPATRGTLLRNLLPWTLSFLAIPIAGYLGTAIVGRVDNVVSALTGGALVGLVIGVVQGVASRRRLSPVTWTIASAIGTSLGVAAGTLVVGYQTSLDALALGGLVTGVVLGFAQMLALPPTARFRWLWLPVTAALWPLAWTVTTLAGIRVDEQFIIFGASGAFVYTLVAGLVLEILLRRATSKWAGDL